MPSLAVTVAVPDFGRPNSMTLVQVALRPLAVMLPLDAVHVYVSGSPSGSTAGVSALIVVVAPIR